MVLMMVIEGWREYMLCSGSPNNRMDAIHNGAAILRAQPAIRVPQPCQIVVFAPKLPDRVQQFPMPLRCDARGRPSL